MLTLAGIANRSQISQFDSLTLLFHSVPLHEVREVWLRTPSSLTNVSWVFLFSATSTYFVSNFLVLGGRMRTKRCLRCSLLCPEQSLFPQEHLWLESSQASLKRLLLNEWSSVVWWKNRTFHFCHVFFFFWAVHVPHLRGRARNSNVCWASLNTLLQVLSFIFYLLIPAAHTCIGEKPLTKNQ